MSVISYDKKQKFDVAYVGRGPPENYWGSGAPVQRTGGTGGSYGPGSRKGKKS